MKILITGARGFVGRNLCAQLNNIKDGKAYAFGEEITLDEGWNWNSVSCPVFAVACQAEGFDNAAAAMDAAFGANYNPWGTTASNWQ